MNDYNDKETLRKLYWDEKMTLKEIAEKAEVTDKTVHNWMKKHGIERRSRGYNATGRPRQYDNEELLEWIDSFVQVFGIVPIKRDLVKYPGPSYKIYQDRFGSFTDAVRKAGYTPRGDK